MKSLGFGGDGILIVITVLCKLVSNYIKIKEGNLGVCFQITNQNIYGSDVNR